MTVEERLQADILRLFDEKITSPVYPDRLVAELSANEEAVLDVLDILEAKGKLFCTKSERYGLPRMMDLIVGRLRGNERGFAFITSDDHTQPDAYVGRGNFGTAIHGDRVVARVSSGSRREGSEAKVIRVLKRARETIVGTFKERAGVGFVDPLDMRIHVDVAVPRENWNGATAGLIVVAEVLEWDSPRQVPVGKIVEVLGEATDPGVDILAIIRKHELFDAFPEEVLKEAEDCDPAILDEEWSWRRDLTEDYIITIDPIDAKDFDDALSLEKTADGWKLGVHIADVSHYVAIGGELDEEAFERGTSVYLPDRVLPMLPERLSNFVCSLRPDEVKRTVSVLAELDHEGNLTGVEVLPTAIKSNYRLWYELAQDMIEGKRSPAVREFSHEKSEEELAKLTDSLKEMNDLAGILRKKRMKRGALDLDQPEAKIVLDEATGVPVDIHLKKHIPTHSLIEEFMLLANEITATILQEAKGSSIFRIHDKPNPKALSRLAKSLKHFKLNFDGPSLSEPSGLQALIDMLKGKPLERLIKYMLLRSLPRASYSVKNIGHFGLASQCYTHFTSPIRRFPDLIVHRQIKALHNKEGSPFGKERLQEIAAQVTAREEIAEEAERETDKYKKLEYLTKRLGQVFKGTITGVIAKGLFVELDNLLVEGMLGVANLTDDYYRFEEAPDRLVGRGTQKVYKLGDRLKVQVVKVDLAAGRMDLLPEGLEATSKRQAKRRINRPAGQEPKWKKYVKKGSTNRSRGNRKKK